MKKSLLTANVLALIATIVLNYLSNTGIFNGATMASISAKYQNYFTPAGYAFSIWGLIYAGLCCFLIYTGRAIAKQTENSSIVLNIGWWFVISCAANSIWVIAWLYNYTAVSVLIMSILLFSLFKIVQRIHGAGTDVSKFVRWPFSIYAGWITVAFIANLAAYLTKMHLYGSEEQDVFFTLFLIFIAGLTNLYVTWKGNTPAFALAGAWALVAIAVANWVSQPPIAYIALAVAIILIVSGAVYTLKMAGDR